MLERSARENVLNAGVLKTAHVGISVYEPATGKTWYDYQGDHYFVPASNTKIPTCYAAMKYLGDSLVGLRYYKDDDGYVLQGAGDPTFLNREFRNQPIYNFLKGIANRSEIDFCINNWKEQHLGSGWSWNDYNAGYMAERSPFPIYGNVVEISTTESRLNVIPKVFDTLFIYLPGITSFDSIQVERELDGNYFNVRKLDAKFRSTEIPFHTQGYEIPIVLLNDTLRPSLRVRTLARFFPNKSISLHSQPTDSLLRPMMHRSDNFFAEQTILMVSNELLGFMNDEKIIDTLLKTDFKDLPQKPRWVDGSGLSRYNLFTPQDFVFILNKMKNEFGMARVKNIFATGGEGTLSNYYVNDKDFIYAKTGSLSGVVAISGFLETKRGKQLIFSVQVNNHNGSATEVRRAVEKFVEEIREQY